MADVFLQLTDIHKSFAGVQALRDVDLTVERGKIHCLVGENGCGKSTLIKIIAGVYARDAGTLLINGVSYPRLHPIDAIREGIQVIYQDFSLFPNLTVAENIALNEELADGQRLVNWRHVRRIAADALAQIDVDIPLDARVEDVSVANKQLIAISKALRQNAQLIIMDEPTSALTEREIRSLFAVIHKLQEQGIAFLFVSHKLNEVLEISETMIVMRNGRIVSVGDRGDYDNARLIFEMTGHEHRGEIVRVRAGHGSAGVDQGRRSVSRRFAGRRSALNCAPARSWASPGCWARGAPNWRWRSSACCPSMRATSDMDGEPVKLDSIQDAIAHGIGYVPEDRLTEGLFLEQSIGRNVVVRTIDRLLGALGLTDVSRGERTDRRMGRCAAHQD